MKQRNFKLYEYVDSLPSYFLVVAFLLLFVLAHANLPPKYRSNCSGPKSDKKCCSKLVDNNLFVQLL